MPNCPKCGNKTIDDLVFCPKCGAPLRVGQPRVGQAEDLVGNRNEKEEKHEKGSSSTTGRWIGIVILLFIFLVLFTRTPGYNLTQYATALLFAVPGIAIIVIVAAVTISRAMATRRRIQVPELIARAEGEANLLKATKLLARAFLIDQKRKSENKDTYAIDRYVGLTRTVICQATLRDDKKTLESMKKIHETLRTAKLVLDTSRSNQMSQLDSLLKSALNGDLGPVVDIAVDEYVILKSITEVLDMKGEIKVEDMAQQLGYTLEAMWKLLEKSVRKHKLEGFLTVDGRCFILKGHLTKLLINKIEVNDSENA